VSDFVVVEARVPDPEYRRVREPQGSRITKVHFIHAGHLRCREQNGDDESWFWDHEAGTERVTPREFSGEQACVLCYAALAGISQQEAKLHLQGEESLFEKALKEMPEVRAQMPETAKPGAWIDRSEVRLDQWSGQIHYTLRGPGGWNRHKVVIRDPKSKDHDPKLYDFLAGWLGFASDESGEDAEQA
jgi:hypothetical protein